jgi:hypothetical protein
MGCPCLERLDGGQFRLLVSYDGKRRTRRFVVLEFIHLHIGLWGCLGFSMRLFIELLVDDCCMNQLRIFLNGLVLVGAEWVADLRGGDLYLLD